MGRSPCCSKEGLNRGAWTAREDKILTDYIKTHGEGRWRNLPKKAGLKRCGKSCRLRWLNYLRPDIKRGNISGEEEELIIRLHKLLGNRWSLIAGRLPGRTDNEIKNYWNTTLGKKVQKSNSPTKAFNRCREKGENKAEAAAPATEKVECHVVRTKATRCTKVFMAPMNENQDSLHTAARKSEPTMDVRKIRKSETERGESPSPSPSSLPRLEDDTCNDLMDFDMSKLLDSEFLQLCGTQVQDSDNWSREDDLHNYNNNNNNGSSNDNMDSGYNCLSSSFDQSLFQNETMLEDWLGDDCFHTDIASELQSLTSFLDSDEDWL